MLKRIARGKITEKDNLEKELDELVNQINTIMNDIKVVSTKTFYTSSTSGGTVNIKNTVKMNQYGKVISWEQV